MEKLSILAFQNEDKTVDDYKEMKKLETHKMEIFKR